MSKLLLSIDDCVFKHNGIYYVKSVDVADLLSRYGRVFEQVRVVARIVDSDELSDNAILIDDKCLEVYEVPLFKGIKQYVSSFPIIKKRLRNVTDGCDACVLRMPSNLGHLVWKRVVAAKIPYAVEVVYDSYGGYHYQTGLYRILGMVIHKNLQRTCFGADGVACVTERYLQKYYYTKKSTGFTSHYSSIFLDKSFYSAPRNWVAKDVYTIAHIAQPIVVTNGRKGHVEVIKALALLKQEGYNVRVRFAGHGNPEELLRLRNLAERLGVADRVEFVGLLPKQELRKLLLESDLYVMPTRAEGLPRAIIEAMAVGLPCISTRVSGNPELLQSQYLLDYDDVRGLADTIKTFITDAQAYEEASNYNFANSLKYERSILQKRRDEFYSNLKRLKII